MRVDFLVLIARKAFQCVVQSLKISYKLKIINSLPDLHFYSDPMVYWQVMRQDRLGLCQSNKQVKISVF